jgi:hypothetical protein
VDVRTADSSLSNVNSNIVSIAKLGYGAVLEGYVLDSTEHKCWILDPSDLRFFVRYCVHAPF